MRRSILITGCSSGIGFDSALKFQQRGWQVIASCRNAEDAKFLKNTYGLDIVCIDYEKPATIENGFKEALALTGGRLDVLFNNAGTFLSSKTIDEINFNEWKEVIEVNLNGMFLFSKYAFALMKNQSPKGGRIINNGSVSSTAPRPGSIAYTATKHAVSGMTKSLSLDGRPFSIVCSQIDIGNADTPMTKGIQTGIVQADGSIKKEPTFDPKHVADAVLHLVSLPLDTNILNMTIMASNMPYIGRG